MAEEQITDAKLHEHLTRFKKYRDAKPEKTDSQRLCLGLARHISQTFGVLPTPTAKAEWLLFGNDEAPSFACIGTVNSDRTAVRIDLDGREDKHGKNVESLLKACPQGRIRIEIQSDADMPVACDAIRRAYQLNKAKTEEKRAQQLRRGTHGR
jgi:hypothetical protein